MTKLLLEASGESPVKVGNRWRGVLAKPGQGSSGFYSEDVLREYGPKALAPGAKAFIDHKEDRSPKDMIGVYPDGAHYEEGVGLVGELEVFPHWADFVEAVGPHAGLSIYMLGEADDDGNVTALFPDRMNGVDLVSYPGLEGSGLVEKLYESAHKASVSKADSTGTATVEAADKNKEQNLMEISELAEKVDALSESIKTLVGVVTPLAESLKPEVKPEVDVAAAVESAIDKAEEAGIPKELRSAVIETAKSGGNVENAIASQKAIVEAVKAKLAAADTRMQEGVFGGASTDSHDYTIAGLI
jgi:hypothetical protein